MAKRDEAIMGVWTEFKAAHAKVVMLEAAGDDITKAKQKSDTLRNQLIQHYMHLVRYNAERVHQKLPKEVELDDVVSSGVFGLNDAIIAFDLERGIKFETYSAPRIRGSILDELRNMDWVPRLVRSRSSKADAARKVLIAANGTNPTPREMAKHMNVTMKEYEKINRDSKAVGVVSLNRKYFETDSNKDVREIDLLVDKKSTTAWSGPILKELKEIMTKGMDRKERLIVVLYYFEEMTMREIGQTLDLSESRVSQMHSNIIARVRGRLADKNYAILPRSAVQAQLPA